MLRIISWCSLTLVVNGNLHSNINSNHPTESSGSDLSLVTPWAINALHTEDVLSPSVRTLYSYHEQFGNNSSGMCSRAGAAQWGEPASELHKWPWRLCLPLECSMSVPDPPETCWCSSAPQLLSSPMLRTAGRTDLSKFHHSNTEIFSGRLLRIDKSQVRLPRSRLSHNSSLTWRNLSRFLVSAVPLGWKLYV